MKLIIIDEAEKIWTRLHKNSNASPFAFSLEIHKKLLSFFQVGEYYYYLFNLKELVFETVSLEITTILGYRPEEINVPFFMNLIHPDDQPWFLNFENQAAEFTANLTTEQILNYKVRFDFRIRKKDGAYMRILHQAIAVDCKDGGIIRTLGIHTDISHLKQEGRPVLSFIGLNGLPSYVNVNAKKVYNHETVLSKREQEVLTLLVDGKTSEEIGKLLFISTLTVQVHRKNLLRKTGCESPAKLIAHAITQGLV